MASNLKSYTHSYYNDMYNTTLYLVTSVINHNVVLYISIEQLCKYDFEFVTICISQHHNKIHQKDTGIVPNTRTIVPSKRSFLCDF